MNTTLLGTLSVCVALAIGGCDQKNHPGLSAEAADAPADNTRKNARDRGADALTPIDQGGNEIDRTITQRIRQSVMKEDSLSMTAKNVKIITIDGVVTLRGPVQNDQERTLITSLAQQTGNVKRVDNQLELAAN